MKQTNDDFHILYDRLKAAVSVRYFAGRAEFLVTIEDAAPVTIYRQISPEGRKEWASESDITPDIVIKLGILIDDYLRSLAKNSKRGE